MCCATTFGDQRKPAGLTLSAKQSVLAKCLDAHLFSYVCYNNAPILYVRYMFKNNTST